MRYSALIFIMFLNTAQAVAATETTITAQPTRATRIAWPVTPPLSAPDGLRPCCAFGFDLKVQALGIPVPFYQLGNVVDANQLGHHRYNDSAFGAVSNVLGLSSERDGLLYTRRGGFIDIAHVRDTADNTLYLFSQILPRLGQRWQLSLGEELAQRRIQLNAFTPPTDAAQRYTLAAYLAGKLAYQLAAWHEIAQWYGYQSVPGFSEEISAFSPEDLYSNLLGARLAIDAILQGGAVSVGSYNRAMESLLPAALNQLGAVSATQTRRQLAAIDGDWWDSHRRVPEKFLVLKRNYDTGDNRLPTPVPFERTAPQRLMLPQQRYGIPLDDIGELQLWPGSSPRHLPPPSPYYTAKDFSALALHARAEDARQILEKR
ncbi:DUF4056 domain-containing protein [Serratia sp. JUb9]|nr:hypothetical protein CLM71_00965 [Serratia sp. MYb239]MBU3892715.1 DUF4056 domain-containing protein [Serratia rubidaea]QNK32291.1 DUF4056 domain-containing protein [Serratia sp. JUb9]CAE1141191.1 conserved exported protein of unknown function [Serratia sp. Tan611]QPT12566.1 DUF4056 domain-containing protein [Serratia rubidaea]